MPTEEIKSQDSKKKIPVRSWVLKINNTFRVYTGILDILIPMCNLLEYSESYSITSERLWN